MATLACPLPPSCQPGSQPSSVNTSQHRVKGNGVTPGGPPGRGRDGEMPGRPPGRGREGSRSGVRV